MTNKLVPICCVCKKIRTDQGKWVETTTQLNPVECTHGYCHECTINHYLTVSGDLDYIIRWVSSQCPEITGFDLRHRAYKIELTNDGFRVEFENGELPMILKLELRQGVFFYYYRAPGIGNFSGMVPPGQQKQAEIIYDSIVNQLLQM